MTGTAPSGKRSHRTLLITTAAYLGTINLTWHGKVESEHYAWLTIGLVIVAAGKWWADKALEALRAWKGVPSAPQDVPQQNNGDDE